MPQSLVQVYLHIVFSTKKRQPYWDIDSQGAHGMGALGCGVKRLRRIRKRWLKLWTIHCSPQSSHIEIMVTAY